jgi:glutamate 5-kinase
MVVVVKIGTSSLTDEQGIIRREAIEKLCLEVAGARESGHQVVIVTSGAIGAGLHRSTSLIAGSTCKPAALLRDCSILVSFRS